MATRSQTDAHRRDLDELVRLALVDLGVVYNRNTDPEAIRDDLENVIPSLIALYGAAAATLAADWYDDLRDAAALRGPRFRAIPTELPDPGRGQILARWSVEPLFSDTPDLTIARQKASGGLQRVITDQARQTITVSSTEDKASPGWERVTFGGCDFCQMLAGFHQGATFTSHDNCRCAASPSFG